MGIDHNVSPPEDVAKYGELAVQEGKITRKQLAMLKRNESAHANAVENFPLLAAGVSLAHIAGVDRKFINLAATIYTIARVAYGPVYILIDHPKWSQIRGLLWWTGNLSSIAMLWKAGQSLNAGQ